jgi:alpha-beta hydrolase superfamily lysophospholipase
MPSPQTLRIVEHIHGHSGWLAAVALLHPAIVLRRNRGGAWAVGLATGLVTVVAGVGVWLYTPFREHVRQRLFQTAPSVGMLFERKEHLAFGAVMFAWVGALAYVGKQRVLSHRAYVAAAGIAITAAILGTVAASYRTF